MKVSILDKMLKLINALDEIEDGKAYELTSDKIIELFKNIEFSNNDIIDAALNNEINNKDVQVILLNYLMFQELVFKEILDEQLEKTENDLSFIFFGQPDLFQQEIDYRKRRNTKFLKIFKMTSALIEQKIKELCTLSDVAPTIDRKIKGKIPKAKKQDQILAEDWAKDIWKKKPTITQENMAYQLKDKLDLKQSIRTIQNWIKPFQPKP